MSQTLAFALIALCPLAVFPEPVADTYLDAPASDSTSDNRTRQKNDETDAIMIDPEYPHSFRYHSGERFFPMGDTAYFLIAQPKQVIAHYIDVRRAHKFNFIRMMAMADGFWPFGGTPGEPEYTVINETAMRKWDWVFDYAAARGMNIELILWGYGVAGGEGLWASPTNQDFWIGALVNRSSTGRTFLCSPSPTNSSAIPTGSINTSQPMLNGPGAWPRASANWMRSIPSAVIHPSGLRTRTRRTRDQDRSLLTRGLRSVLRKSCGRCGRAAR